MVDFRNLKKKEVKATKLTVTIKVDLLNCGKTAEEAAERIEALIRSHRSNEFSGLTVFLIRECSASWWDNESVEIVDTSEVSDAPTP